MDCFSVRLARQRGQVSVQRFRKSVELDVSRRQSKPLESLWKLLALGTAGQFDRLNRRCLRIRRVVRLPTKGDLPLERLGLQRFRNDLSFGYLAVLLLPP